MMVESIPFMEMVGFIKNMMFLFRICIDIVIMMAIIIIIIIIVVVTTLYITIESIMSQKTHGTSNQPAQKNLRWNVDYKTADRISNYNRRFAEYSGYFASDSVTFLNEIREQAKKNPSEPMTFYDTNTGKPLFKAPIGKDCLIFLLSDRSY